ncbi:MULTISPECIES: hypothetical protein [Streptomyces]|uniref:hypothetical protein n=1 Tax=Streptomyces TaxID=1883 RepID=UPI000A746422|nr:MULTISPECIES: hypothetical protein [Streptomyces]MDP9950158.1 hypothetical protein [Streptomyces sp. DSM 41269]
MTTTVPWADVQEVALDGALAITSKDGEELGPVAFGGSLLGEITGYRVFFLQLFSFLVPFWEPRWVCGERR